MGLIQRDAIRMTIITYLGVVIGYVNKVLLFTNILSTEEVGLANLLVSIATLYATLSAVGMNSITLRFFPFFRSKEKGHHGFFFFSTLFISIGFILVTLLFFVFKDQILGYYSENSPLIPEYYLYLIPLGLATLFYSFFEAYLRSLYKNVVPVIVNEVVLRLLVCASVLIYHFKLVDFKGFVIVYVIANILPALILLLYISYLKELFIKPRISVVGKRLSRIIVMYGMFAFANGASGIVLTVLDGLMVAGEINMEATGIFTTMVFLASVMLVPYRAIGKVASPMVSDFWKEKNIKGMSVLYKKVTVTNLVTGSFLFTIIWVNIENIFELMPPVFRQGKYVFFYIGLARLFDMYTGLNSVILATSKKFRYDLLFTIFLLVLTFFSNKLLIPLMGMEGAAVASLITIILYNIFRTVFVYSIFRIHPFSVKDLLIVMIVMITISVSMIIPRLDNWIVDGIIRTVICSAVYIIPVYFTGMFPEMNVLLGKYFVHPVRKTLSRKKK